MKLLRALGAMMLVLSVALIGAPATAATSAATYVFGQNGNYTTGHGYVTANSLNQASASTHDPVHHRMFIADQQANRVLVYNLNANNSIPDDTADYVLGQSSFTTNTASLTATGMSGPNGLAYDSGADRLYVADAGYKRILVFNTASITNGMAASYVIGQSDFTSQATATTQSGFQNTRGLALDGNNRYLFATDQNNRRVMVFDTTALSNGMNATYVLGQPSFTATVYAISQSTTFFPVGVAVDPALNRLYVAGGANRVQAFDLSSLATNMNSSYVIGQPDFTSSSSGLSQTTLNGPLAVGAGGGRVYVVDGNQRVLSYDSSNTANGQPAVGVYGQPDYQSGTVNNGGTSASSLAFPNGVSFDPGTFRFFVADSGNSRVLGYNAAVVSNQVTTIVDPSLTFTVAGHSGTCNGVSLSPGSSASGSAVGLGRINSSNGVGAQDLTVSTNASNGYSVYLRNTSALQGSGRTFADVGGTNASPVTFPGSSTEAFGYTTSSSSLLTGTANRFTSGGAKWAAATNTDAEVSANAGLAASDTACLAFQAQASSTTPAGAYSTTIVYTAAGRF